MNERQPNSNLMREDDLEVALTEMAGYFEYPATPDLASRVSIKLTEPAAHFDWRPFGFGRRRFPSSLLTALVGVLLVTGSVIAVGIGLRGLGITFVDEPPPASDELHLGERLTLAEAQARVSYRILLPDEGLGQPDEVFLDTQPAVEQVSLVYRRNGGIELLLTQFVASPDVEVATKLIGPVTTVEPVSVAGTAGLWIEGEPHVLLYRNSEGSQLEDRVRLVGNVLLWQRGELTLRLEGVSSRDEAMRLAESVE
ncbi:hypothetical protein BH24CHL6_BH24CHL6_00700 [soil metagenome]